MASLHRRYSTGRVLRKTSCCPCWLDGDLLNDFLTNSRWFYHFLSEGQSVHRLISAPPPLHHQRQDETCTGARVHTHSHKQAAGAYTLLRTVTIEHQFFWSKGEVVNSRRREILLDTHKHNTQTHVCLSVKTITSHNYNMLNHKSSEYVSSLQVMIKFRGKVIHSIDLKTKLHIYILTVLYSLKRTQTHTHLPLAV